MNLKPIAILLSASIGIAIQLQCCAFAADEQVGSDSKPKSNIEPGVPIDSTEPDAIESVPIESVPIDSVPIPKSPEPIGSEMTSPVVPQRQAGETFFPKNNFSPPNMTPQQIPGPILQVETPQSPENLSEQQPKKGLFSKLSKTLLEGGAKKDVPQAERPWWIPGHALTNDSMVAPYHNLDIAWWDKRPIPNRPQWVRLSQSVTRYWRGTVAEPCFVLVSPLEQVPGNFTFRSRSPFGPRGWLQALGTPDRRGFPQYRYWLDQP